MISETEVVWMAGVTDAMGRIETPRVALVTVKYQVTRVPNLAEHITALLGTSPLERGRVEGINPLESYARKGCREHCPEAHIHVHPSFRSQRIVQASGIRAYILLWNLFPYLRAKRDLASLAMDAYQSAANPVTKAVMVARKMQSIGWQIPDDVEIVLDTEEAA
jgi:hypothetical protein